MIEVELPMPPSANNLFTAITVKGKTRWIIKRGYKEWRERAGEALMAQYAAHGAPAIHKPVALSIRLNVNYQSDIANREKAITDLLVEHMDMPDDRWIDRIVIERDRSVEACVVSIEGASE